LDIKLVPFGVVSGNINGILMINFNRNRIMMYHKPEEEELEDESEPDHWRK